VQGPRRSRLGRYRLRQRVIVVVGCGTGPVAVVDAVPALPDDGYLIYSPPYANYVESDAVGMNAIVLWNHEGNPLPPFGAANTERSYVRVGRDTNDNAADFAMRSPSSPQNSGMCGR
jgi:hypothetical protein